jgi:hypothetical protein
VVVPKVRISDNEDLQPAANQKTLSYQGITSRGGNFQRPVCNELRNAEQSPRLDRRRFPFLSFTLRMGCLEFPAANFKQLSKLTCH